MAAMLLAVWLPLFAAQPPAGKDSTGPSLDPRSPWKNGFASFFMVFGEVGGRIGQTVFRASWGEEPPAFCFC